MCQKMLWRGVAHLAEVNPPVEMWEHAKTYPGIYGVMSTEGQHLKDLEAAILHEGEDATGAMHHAVMSHLAYIHKYGVDAWLKEAEKHLKPEGFFQWNGDLS